MKRLLFVACVVVACVACHAPRPVLPLVTTGEASGFTKTAHYDEAVTLCHDFARVYSGVRCEEIGRTFEDRPIVALVISSGGHHPTVLVEAGIHAGEIEGKDAGFWFLRDLLDGKVAAGALDAIDLVFVPCINPDGHERFGPNNRPNQRGPVEMGFRTNAARLNINRDFMKADSPEIRAVLGLFRRFDPVLFVDLHTTDGAKFEHDIAVLVAPVAARADSLEETAHALSDHLQARLTALGHLPLPFYPSFDKDDDPSSGFSIGEAPPRFSQYYAAARSRLGILVETHSWRTYKERATSTYHLLQALAERAVHDAPSWARVAREADAADQALRGGKLTLVYDNGAHATQLAFRGYAYEKRASDLTGGTWIVYDERTPQIWNVPLHDELVPQVVASVPKAGYVIDGGFAQLLAPVLALHGIEYTKLRGQPRVPLEVYRATKVTFQPPFEGRTRVALEGAWAAETRTLDRGAIFVSLDQPRVRLIVQLLDPGGPDSFAQWGFVTTAFERKEYMESYVVEEAARTMLAADPALRAKLDAETAGANADQKREWLYRRHPAWDERMNLLPIYRSARDLKGM